MAPLLQLGGRHVSVNQEAVQAASETIQRTWHVRVPGMLDGPTLDLVRAEIARGTFRTFVHEGVGVEHCLEEGRLVDRLVFLLNDPAVLALAARLVGAPRLGCFVGRIYRVQPGAGHHDGWHDDLKQTRMLALTLNLSDGVYRGSTLTMRRKGEEGSAIEIPNLTPGDAILFALRGDLEHRISDIEGDAPKTALAGWFCVEPDFHAQIRAPRAAGR